jgi:hypothetical protein
MRISNIVTTVGLALSAATASAQSVTYDYDKSADFSKLKTYAWTTGTNVADQLNHKRIVSSIDAQMTAKGFTLVSRDSAPDVLVAYHARFDKNLEINGFENGFGAPRFGASRSGRATVDEVTTGTLVVDLMDPNTRSVLWSGIAAKELDAKAKPEKKDKNAAKAAEKIFANYPPKAHGAN